MPAAMRISVAPDVRGSAEVAGAGVPPAQRAHTGSGYVSSARWAVSLKLWSVGVVPVVPMVVIDAGAQNMRHTISSPTPSAQAAAALIGDPCETTTMRSEEHTSELQSLMRNSY